MQFLSAILLLLSYSPLGRAMSLDPSVKRMLKDVNANLQRLLDKAELIHAPSLAFATKPESQTVAQGSRLTLTCEISGIPLATVHWLKNGKRIRQSRIEDVPNIVEKMTNYGMRTYEEGGTTSKLRLGCLSIPETATYTCVAENGYERIETDAEIIVAADNRVDSREDTAGCVDKKTNSMPAEIFMWTDVRVEREGANVQLMCRAKGKPAPRISWLDPNDNLIENNDFYQILQTGDLLIKNADFRVNGGTHKCLAVNEHGQDQVDSFLYPTKYDGEDELPARTEETEPVEDRR